MVASYDLQPGNRVGLFAKEKISKGLDKQGKSDNMSWTAPITRQ